MIKKLYREEFETALRDAPVGSIVIDDDGDVFRYTGHECGFLLPSSPSEAIAYRVLADYVSYPVMLIKMGSAEPIAEDKEPTSVLSYLTKVWDEASEPPDNCIPAGSVVIRRNDDTRPDYTVWTVVTDLPVSPTVSIRIVSSPPPKVGFYVQHGGFAYYWDGSVWRLGKGCRRSPYQDYGFSEYIGDVKEDK